MKQGKLEEALGEFEMCRQLLPDATAPNMGVETVKILIRERDWRRRKHPNSSGSVMDLVMPPPTEPMLPQSLAIYSCGDFHHPDQDSNVKNIEAELLQPISLFFRAWS